MSFEPGVRGRAWPRIAGLTTFLALILLAAPGGARADLGGVLAQGVSGPFAFSVVASPWPLRVGSSEWSVLVRDTRTGRVRRDLRVQLGLGTEPTETEAAVIGLGGVGKWGPHPGFYAVPVQLTEAGPGWGRVRARAPDGTEASLTFHWRAGPAQNPWIEHWAALLFPFGLLLIFAWHQVRRRSMARAGTKAYLSTVHSNGGWDK